MGASKTADYTESQLELARFSKALSHPARIAIIQLLLQKRSCICGDIVEDLPIAQSTVSQHLKELKQAGLIRGEIDGTAVCYCIDTAAWEKAKRLLTGLFSEFTEPIKACC